MGGILLAGQPGDYISRNAAGVEAKSEPEPQAPFAARGAARGGALEGGACIMYRFVMRRLRLVSRAALIRLAALFAALALAVGIPSCVMFRMPGRSHSGPLPPLSPTETALRDALRAHVGRLAGEIGGRSAFAPKRLEAAAAWIEGELSSMGYRVTSEPFLASDVPCRNVLVELPGAARKEEIVVVGAHYDSVGGWPGADDNASGVAGLLEIARALRALPPTHIARTVRLVAFANEEPPFFQTQEMGSLVHARAARARGDRIVAMLALETIGYYSDAPDSQRYPAPLGLLYPSTGNFVAFVGDFSSRGLVRDCIGRFRSAVRFPPDGGAPPSWIPGVDWSDHWSFWKAGYPAIMVTDTAPFRNRHYHTSGDRPETLDYDRLARVVRGLIEVVEGIARDGA